MQDLLPPEVPIVSVSKGLEAGTGHMMSEIIPSALGRRQPCAFLSGPSFAKEVMTQCPTGVVAASKVLQRTDLRVQGANEPVRSQSRARWGVRQALPPARQLHAPPSALAELDGPCGACHKAHWAPHYCWCVDVVDEQEVGRMKFSLQDHNAVSHGHHGSLGKAAMDISEGDCRTCCLHT